MWNYLPDKLKSTDNREHFKSMLERNASYLDSTSFANVTSFDHNKDKDFIYFRTFMHSFIRFLFRLLGLLKRASN